MELTNEEKKTKAFADLRAIFDAKKKKNADKEAEKAQT